MENAKTLKNEPAWTFSTDVSVQFEQCCVANVGLIAYKILMPPVR